jgi:hypothetical protein
MGRRQWWRDPAKERRWRRMVRRWEKSGLSVREFCDWQALSEASFYAWRRELAVRDREAPSRRENPVNDLTSNFPQFLPVQVVAESALDSGVGRCLEVQLPTGVRLQVPPGFDRQTLCDTLAALGSAPC